jgi:predicted phosphodiesterase
MAKTKPSTEIIKKYLRKFPNTPSRTLAKILHKDYPQVFLSDEDARNGIRRLRHLMVNEKHSCKEFVNQKKHSVNPFQLPESEAKEYKQYIIPEGNNRILFLSDIHIPYHNVKALTLALKYGKEKKVNTIYLNGDIMDCYQASHHERDALKRSLAYEIEQTKDFLKTLKKHFPECKIYFKEGNHEKRWRRYLRRCAPALLGIEEFELPILLNFGEMGIEWIPNELSVKAGKLNIIHGNEYFGNSLNPGKFYFDKAGENIIGGDKHRTSEFIKRSIGNKVEGGWSVGCLCELNPEYFPFNNWNLGFSYIEFNKDLFHIENKKIIEGKVL